ncbi:D-serine dehydratase [Apiospora kogelbergensis]|uniref:D-serine dehydratase n=1 Tax=Apiospora kogelbergensis TaxID=1337665 RepID=UPI00312CD9FD
MTSAIALNIDIAEPASVCRVSFLDCLACADLMKLEWAENRLADFDLWALDFMRYHTPVDGRPSPDDHTRNVIVHVLKLLHSCIQQCLSLANSSTTASFAQASRSHHEGGLPPPEALSRSFSPFSDESSDSEPELHLDNNVNDYTALTSAMRNVEQLMNELTRISLAIGDGGTPLIFRKADKVFHPDNYGDLQTYLENIVNSRPPGPLGVGLDVLKNDITPAQKRLVEANLRRRNRFVCAMHILVPSRQGEDYYLELGSRIPRESPDMKLLGSIEVVSKLASTSASSLGTLPPLLPLPAKALPPPATMAQITTTAAKVVYPKPPKVEAGFGRFKCPCCCQSLPLLYQESTHWKPYTCILDDCPSPEAMYRLRSDWFTHIEHDHRKSWRCLYCSMPGTVPRLFTTVETLTQHIRSYHADAVSDEQIAAAVRTALGPSLFGVSSCPLCNITGTSDSDMLYYHIAEHIHAFSLQSLPWPDDARIADYFSQNNYFDDDSDTMSQRCNVSDLSNKDFQGLPSLEDNARDANVTTENREERRPPGKTHQGVFPTTTQNSKPVLKDDEEPRIIDFS